MTEWNNFERVLAEIGTEASGKMPRQARVDAPGTLHHEMLPDIEWTHIVPEHSDRAGLVAQLA